MKVLFVASSTYMPGGATKSLLSMLSQLQAHGVEFEIICPDEKGLTQWLRQQGIKVHVCVFLPVYHPRLRNIADFIKWIPRLIYYNWINFRGKTKVKRIARMFSPDIVHENSSTINLGYHAARAIKVPYVMHIREFGSLEFNMSVPGRSKRLRDENTFPIPITKALRSFLGLDHNRKAAQIYDGIVTDSDFRMNEDKKKWLLYAGRIEEAKGIGDLLEAYADYAHTCSNPLPIRICGEYCDPPYLEEIKEYAEKEGIAEHLEWYGQRTDIADFMFEAAATIMPSRCEGLGRVMPEAMANGSLCVARNVSGTKEQLENGELLTGAPIAIAYETRAQLTKALHHITESIEQGYAFSPGSEFHQMIERSQTAVREFFSEERFGEKILHFYEGILSNNKKDN